MLRTGAFFAMLLSMGVFVAPSTAHAQAPDPSPEQLQEARQLFFDAISLEAAGNWSAALAKLEKVARVKTTYQVRFHLGRCKENLGRLNEALGDYELAAHDATQQQAEDLSEITSALESLKARIPRLAIKVAEAPVGTRVSVNGVELGKWSEPITVDGGKIKVEARAGSRTVSQVVEPKEGETLEVLLTFPEEKEPAAEEPKKPSAPPVESSGRQFTAPVLIAGGVGIAGLAASGVFLGLRQGAITRAEDACGPRESGGSVDCSELDPVDDADKIADAEQANKDGKLYSALTTVSIGVGVAGLATATVLYFVQEPKRANGQTTGLQVGANVGATGGLLSLRGSF